MTTRVGDSTLESFCHAAGSADPLPAGVAVAAVSSAFALGLLAKVLAVSGRRKALAEHLPRLESLTAAARAASHRMLELADEDVAAFQAYLATKRSSSAVERTVEVPLAAAQQAAAGLQLCTAASTLAPAELTADLGVTAAILSGALRGFLLCAQSNVRQLPPEAASLRERVATEAKRHGL